MNLENVGENVVQNEEINIEEENEEINIEEERQDTQIHTDSFIKDCDIDFIENASKVQFGSSNKAYHVSDKNMNKLICCLEREKKSNLIPILFPGITSLDELKNILTGGDLITRQKFLYYPDNDKLVSSFYQQRDFCEKFKKKN